MATFYVGDKGAILEFSIFNSDSPSPVTLSDGTAVNVTLIKPDSTKTTKTATIKDVSGVVEVSLASTDLSLPGTYTAQPIVVFSASKEHTANPVTFNVESRK